MASMQGRHDMLKRVDINTRYLIHGYIRSLERLLLIDIPLSIIEICILFYFVMEFFETAGANIIISGKYDEIITKTACTDWWNMSFGATWIESMSSNIYKWTFKIIQVGTKEKDGFEEILVYDDIVIGIISKQTSRSNPSWLIDESSVTRYFFRTKGVIRCNGSALNDNYGNEKDVGFKVHSIGNIIVMELNLLKETLTYYVNGKSLGIAIDHIEKDKSIKYKMAVTICRKNAALSLQKFEIVRGQ